MKTPQRRLIQLGGFLAGILAFPALAQLDIQLTGVPDYDWQFGCFGTCTGNLMAYWDRHGFPDFYTGPTGGGLAPLSNIGTNNNGIIGMWASQAGIDGRPAGQFGHVDDYYVSYASISSDRYVLSNRTEHVADCIGDFIGLNQKRWTNMNNECDGNIDGYAFVFWDTNGTKRINYAPPPQGNVPVKDIPSGLRAWARWRGYEADVFSQLVAFNPKCPTNSGFKFADVKAEIDAGYPVMAFLQNYSTNSRSIGSMTKANPEIHAMLIYGYYISPPPSTTNVYVREGYASGEKFKPWNSSSWLTFATLPVRGILGFHPKPKLRSLAINGSDVTLAWDGPSSEIYDDINLTTTPAHYYQVEKSTTMSPADFQPIGPVTSDRNITIQDCCGESVFYRVRLLP